MNHLKSHFDALQQNPQDALCVRVDGTPAQPIFVDKNLLGLWSDSLLSRLLDMENSMTDTEKETSKSEATPSESEEEPLGKEKGPDEKLSLPFAVVQDLIRFLHCGDGSIIERLALSEDKERRLLHSLLKKLVPEETELLDAFVYRQEAGNNIFTDKLKHAFNSPAHCDFKFFIKDESTTTTFCVLKNIISRKDNTFSLMFNSGMLESTAEESSLADINPKAFESMLWWLWTGEFKVDADNAVDVFLAASRYQIAHPSEVGFLMLFITKIQSPRIKGTGRGLACRPS